VIKKENAASLNLARSVGFKEYDQDLDKVYLKR
jgi:L-amino acid N-acyltransferase YncA